MTGTGSPSFRADAAVDLRAGEVEAQAVRARSRHPSARAGGGQLVGPLARVGPLGLGITGPHGEAGAALLAVRGGQGRSQACFAAAYGLRVEQVAAIEAGTVDPEDVPAPVRLLTPFPALVAALLASGRSRVGVRSGTVRAKGVEDVAAGPGRRGQGKG